MNFSGSQGSRNSSKDSRNNSYGRQPLHKSPFDRDGSRGRSTSNTKSTGSVNRNQKLPTNYKPPHMRPNNSGTRVSPVRSSGYGPQQPPKNNRVSPNSTALQAQKPSPSRYANIQSRLYQGTTASQEKRISPRPEPRNSSLPRDQPVRPIQRSTERRASPAQQQVRADPRQMEATKMPPRVRQVATKPLSKNETRPETRHESVNKENTKAGVRANSRGPVEQAKRPIIPTGEDIDGQDIEQKLNRLQDLLKMAKGSV